MKNDPQIEQLAQMVQRGFQAMEKRFDALGNDLRGEIKLLRDDMEHGFAEVNLCIDKVIQPQRRPPHRIKRVEEKIGWPR